MREMMQKIYHEPPILMYLRYHPEWYKILYYDKSRYDEFINEAKSSLKIRTYDKIENWKNQINFLSSIIEYINK